MLVLFISLFGKNILNIAVLDSVASNPLDLVLVPSVVRAALVVPLLKTPKAPVSLVKPFPALDKLLHCLSINLILKILTYRRVVVRLVTSDNFSFRFYLA